MSHRIESGVTRNSRLAAVRQRKLPICKCSWGLILGNSQRSSRGNARADLELLLNTERLA
jgi:hypothetical protein